MGGGYALAGTPSGGRPRGTSRLGAGGFACLLLRLARVTHRLWSVAKDGDWLDEAAGALVGMTLPIVGPLLQEPAKRLVGSVRAEHARNRDRALRAAVQMSGLTREELAERICTTPKLVPLLTRVLHEVGMTGQVEVLDALGAALGDAIREPSRSDEVELVLIGLESVRKQHNASWHYSGRRQNHLRLISDRDGRRPLWMLLPTWPFSASRRGDPRRACSQGSQMLDSHGKRAQHGTAGSATGSRLSGETLLDVLDQLRA